MGDFLCRPFSDVDFYQAIKRSQIIYAALPRLQETKKSEKLGKVILTDLQSSIGAVYSEKDFRPLMPALVVLDEFGSYALPDFGVVFEQAREANVAVVAAFQLTSQLADREKRLSTGFLETVMGNTETKVFMRLKSLESALWASEFFGQELRWFAQVSAGGSRSDAEQMISLRRYLNPRRMEARTSSLTHRQMYDQRVRPEALLHELVVGEAVINWRGEQEYRGWSQESRTAGTTPKCFLAFAGKSQYHSACGNGLISGFIATWRRKWGSSFLALHNRKTLDVDQLLLPTNYDRRGRNYIAKNLPRRFSPSVHHQTFPLASRPTSNIDSHHHGYNSARYVSA